MKLKYLVFLSFILQTQYANCLLDPISWVGLGSAASAIIGAGYYYLYPLCEDVKNDSDELTRVLKEKVLGQHIALLIVSNAVTKHWNNPDPIKPLVMIFHGPPGTGKNYVSKLIAKSMFKNGESSNNYHFYNGRISFPSDGFTEKYQSELLASVKKAIESCENTLFVFDEVDDMAEGVLNILVPIFDYNKHGIISKKVNKNRAIFLLLSNVASINVIDRMLKLWREGRPRENLSILDFEKYMEKDMFNIRGGLRGSDTITTNVIDHYIPFLPLERKHVEECIIIAYKQLHKRIPTKEEIEYVIENMSFGPEGSNLYSESGCKRIMSLVSVYG